MKLNSIQMRIFAAHLLLLTMKEYLINSTIGVL